MNPRDFDFMDAVALHHKGRRTVQPSGFFEYEFTYRTQRDAFASSLRDFGMDVREGHLHMRRSYPCLSRRRPILERKRWYVSTFIHPSEV